jgi:hypothetical protein
VLCLLLKRGQALASTWEEVGASASRSLAAKAPRLPPDYPHTLDTAYQIYAALSYLGGPDTRTCPWQFIPFDPFLPDGMLFRVLPHRLIARERCRLIDEPMGEKL